MVINLKLAKARLAPSHLSRVILKLAKALDLIVSLVLGRAAFHDALKLRDVRSSYDRCA